MSSEFLRYISDFLGWRHNTNLYGKGDSAPNTGLLLGDHTNSPKAREPASRMTPDSPHSSGDEILEEIYCTPKKMVKRKRNPEKEKENFYKKAHEDHDYPHSDKKRVWKMKNISDIGYDVLYALQSNEESTIADIVQTGINCSSMATPDAKRSKVETTRLDLKPTGTTVTILAKFWAKNHLKGQQVCGITTYKDIAKLLKKARLDGKEIAQTIWHILRDETIIEDISTKDLKLISKVTYLLFGAEPSRDPGALIMNAMFLDLVIEGNMGITNIQKLPMSEPGAKGAMRTFATLTRPDSKRLSTDAGLSSDTTQRMLDSCNDITTKWFEAKYPGKKHTLPEIIQTIENHVPEWFGVRLDATLKPSKFTTIQHLDFDSMSDYEEFNEELTPNKTYGDDYIKSSPLLLSGDFNPIDYGSEG